MCLFWDHRWVPSSDDGRILSAFNVRVDVEHPGCSKLCHCSGFKTHLQPGLVQASLITRYCFHWTCVIHLYLLFHLLLSVGNLLCYWCHRGGFSGASAPPQPLLCSALCSCRVRLKETTAVADDNLLSKRWGLCYQIPPTQLLLCCLYCKSWACLTWTPSTAFLQHLNM